jgi:tetratricopeptide (TPR) repeat protein
LADGWYARGSAYYLMGDYERAAADLREAVRLNPANTEIRGVLVKAEARLQAASISPPVTPTAPPSEVKVAEVKPAEVKSPSIKVPEVKPPEIRKAKIEVVEAEPPPATPIAAGAPTKNALPANPGDFEEHHRKGRELVQKGQYRAAIEELTQTIAAKPDMALAWNARGYAYMMLREYAKAIDNFDSAIQLSPNYANAFQNRAAARRAKGDLNGAASDLARVKQLQQ